MKYETLFVVEETFTIKGRGLAIVGFSADQYASIHSGDKLMLFHPDGSETQTSVVAVEYPPSVICLEPRGDDTRFGVVVDASEVPIDTTVARTPTA